MNISKEEKEEMVVYNIKILTIIIVIIKLSYDICENTISFILSFLIC